jgi:2-methylcitrate dehydratase PrpD
VFEPAASKAIPSTSYEARFSGPYCIARALLDGTVAISSFTTEAIQDHEAAKYASRVTYEVEALPEFPDSFPARVVVKLASGEKLESYVHHNLGSPGNPMSPVQYEEKFLTAVRGFLSPDSAQALLAAIRRLAEPDGMKELSNTLRCLQLTG